MPRRGENIRKRKDNRWEGRYICGYDVSGKAKYVSVYGKTYSEVKRKRNEILRQITKDSFVMQDHDYTFQELLFLWLNSNRMDIRQQTYAKYLYMIEKHIIPIIGHKKVKALDATFINQFLNQKRTHGKLNGDGGLSNNYIQTMRFIIKSALDYGVKEKICPVVQGEILTLGKTPQKLEVLSFAEQCTLENYLISNLDERKLGVLIALYTGMRIGEICGLQWKDIDFSTKTIHVHQSVERISNYKEGYAGTKTKLVLGETKTNTSNRIIPIHSTLIPLLQKEKSNHTFILQGTNYEYLDPRTLQYNFQKYLKDCKLRSINFHALRHTFATRCMEADVDIKSLSEILGHANVNITLNIYVHSSLEHKRSELEKLAFIYGQKNGHMITEND